MKRLAPECLDGFASGIKTRHDAGFVPFGGGLLMAAPEAGLRGLPGFLRGRGVPAAVVGEVDDEVVRVAA